MAARRTEFVTDPGEPTVVMTRVFDAPRRLVFEAVYGFLTLKNGVPIGYVLLSALYRSAEVAYNVFDSFRGAETAANDALARFRKVPSDRSVVTALVALSESLIAQGRAADAVPHLREALSTFAQPVPMRFAWMRRARTA